MVAKKKAAKKAAPAKQAEPKLDPRDEEIKRLKADLQDMEEHLKEREANAKEQADRANNIVAELHEVQRQLRWYKRNENISAASRLRSE